MMEHRRNLADSPTYTNAVPSGRAFFGRSPAEIVGSNPTGAWLAG